MARTTTPSTLAQAGRQAENAARAALRNPWIEPLARAGYAARGAVYCLIGLLAIQTAMGSRAQATDTRGVLQTVAQQSVALLWLLALGLFGYAVWRVVQGILDAENKGAEPKGLAIRAGQVISGVIYGSLALAAVRIASGSRSGGSGGGSGTQGWTADLMTKPFGRWLVALAGICVIVSGLAQLRRGWTEKFRRNLKEQEMNESERRLAVNTGKAGLLARGVVFLLSGWFLIQAALRFDPSRATGLGGALEALARQPHGSWLLGLVALGLLAFGAYSILLARYRRIVY
jgi:uncharacterized membrane protein YiaA